MAATMASGQHIYSGIQSTWGRAQEEKDTKWLR